MSGFFNQESNSLDRRKTELDTEDLSQVLRVAQGLWGDPSRVSRESAETVSAIALLDLDSSRTLERSAQSLLARAENLGPVANAQALGHPFYRLSPTERLVVIALHRNRWSFERLARILDESTSMIEQTAWKARRYLASFAKPSSSQQLSRALILPGTAAPASSRCPEWTDTAPWTQRFLDEELGKQEQLFLQNHMMVCGTCRTQLNRTRDLFFAVDGLIPVLRESAELTSRAEKLGQEYERIRKLAGFSPMTLGRSLVLFIQRPDAAGLVFLLLGLLVAKAFWF